MSDDDVIARVREALAEIVADETASMADRMSARQGVRLVDDLSAPVTVSVT